jgi:hypothetical protein
MIDDIIFRIAFSIISLLAGIKLYEIMKWIIKKYQDGRKK